MMYTNKQLLQLTLPLFAEQFLIVFVGVADTFMVSYAGEAAVSGVALVDTISFLITAVLGALCTGGAVVASQSINVGTDVERGTVVTCMFADNTMVD